MIKVGINGFGRIGRFVFRAAMKRNDIQLVGINLSLIHIYPYRLSYVYLPVPLHRPIPQRTAHWHPHQSRSGQGIRNRSSHS